MTAPLNRTLVQALDDFIIRRMRGLRSVLIGKVEAWYPAQQTADILPLVREVVRSDEGTKTLTPDVITRVPVATLAMSGFTIQIAPSVGDIMLVLVSDREIETWLQGSGGMTTPDSDRAHDINDAIAIPFTPARWAAPVSDIASGELVIGRGDGAGELRVKADGTILGGARGAATRGVARLDDTTKSTSAEDTTFWGWVTAVDTAIRAGTGVTPGGGAAIAAAYTSAVAAIGGAAPSSATGKITTASAAMEVE